MQITSNNIYQSNLKNCQPNFKSRSAALRDVDDIGRRVIKEFPVMYSNSKLYRYNSLDKTEIGPKLKCFSEDLIKAMRRNYLIPEDNDSQLFRQLTDMKKYKAGNCGEIADLTKVALNLNGYEDVKCLDLYAYNKETKIMRSLDHSVAGINFKLPDKYQYCYSSRTKVDPKYRIYPQNDSIIVDTWLGKSEYAKQMGAEYNSNKALMHGTDKTWKPIEEGRTLLEENEELCYVPVCQPCFITKDGLSALGRKYENLILKKNKGKVDLSNTKKEIDEPPVPEEYVEHLRIKNEMKLVADKIVKEPDAPKNTLSDKIKNIVSAIGNIL